MCDREIVVGRRRFQNNAVDIGEVVDISDVPPFGLNTPSTSPRLSPPSRGVSRAHSAAMNPTDEQLARFQIALKEDYGRDFSKAEALDAWRRLDTFYRLVTGQLAPLTRNPGQAPDR